MNKQRTERPGFTLVELMVVVAIISVMVAMAIPNFVRYQDSSMRSKCLSNLRAWQGAIEAFFSDNPQQTVINTANSAHVLPYFAGVTAVNKLPKTCPADSTKSYVIKTVGTEANTLPSCPYTVTRSGVTISHVLELY